MYYQYRYEKMTDILVSIGHSMKNEFQTRIAISLSLTQMFKSPISIVFFNSDYFLCCNTQ